jgi:Ulp1 family protease
MNKVLDRFNDDVNKRFINDYNAVKKWGAATLGKDTNPLDYDLIILYNNDDDQHWNLIVLSPKDRVIEQLDSMSHVYHRNLEAVYQWFYDALSFRFPTSVRDVFHNKQTEWKFYSGRFENLQKNGSDCGVFTIAWAIALV